MNRNRKDSSRKAFWREERTMAGKCREATYPGTGPCPVSATKVCAACGDGSSWRHARRPCPRGRKTRFGIQQHLTADERELLEHRTGMSLKKVGSPRTVWKTAPAEPW